MPASSPRRVNTRAVPVRTLFRHLHLWLGLGAGLLFVLLGLTGAALVFYVGIDAALHPAARETAAIGPGWDSPVWDRALAAGRARWPGPAGDWSFEVTGRGGAIPARYYTPASHHDHHAAREMVWFAEDGRRVVRIAPWGGYAMSWIYDLHMALLAGESGGRIVGWSGVAILLLLLSGVLAWWPRGSVRKAIAFKRAAGPIRRLHDLHKLAGLGSAIPLIVLAATGVLLALPEVKSALLAPDPVPAPRSAAAAGRAIMIAQALTAAHGAVPGSRLAFIDVPGADDAPLRLRVQVPGDPHRRFPGSFVFVDRHSARILAVHDIRRGNAGTTIAAWVRPLHDGSVGGLPVRLLAVAAGLCPAFLFATGVLRWRRRRNAIFPKGSS